MAIDSQFYFEQYTEFKLPPLDVFALLLFFFLLLSALLMCHGKCAILAAWNWRFLRTAVFSYVLLTSEQRWFWIARPLHIVFAVMSVWRFGWRPVCAPVSDWSRAGVVNHFGKMSVWVVPETTKNVNEELKKKTLSRSELFLIFMYPYLNLLFVSSYSDFLLCSFVHIRDREGLRDKKY